MPQGQGEAHVLPRLPRQGQAVVCKNKHATESLVKAGAFNSMEHTRMGLTAHFEPMIDNVVAVKRKEAEGQFDLVGSMAKEETSE